MKISVLLRSSFAFLCLLIALSCQDHLPTPGVQRFRLVKTVTTGSSVYTAQLFTYNSAGRVASRTIQVNSATGPSQRTTFAYDGQGRLVSTERLQATSFNGGRSTYSYDGTGNTTSIFEYEDERRDGNLVLVKTTTLDYNGGKLPVKTTTVSSNGITETAVYTYTGENISRSERTFTSSIAAPQVTIINYQHDDKPNPFYGLLYGPPIPEAINRNNVKYDGSERIYNSQGLITNLNTNVNGAAIDQARISYEYEAY